ncbi:regulator of chromosome condensation 1/beta-lactamase-inhibitor protein II [Pyronema omphalodes]|nr:regulator of chromosome condensation 1/beta-lactamase-inhibitor protein II [Pyronema omphalodes]
MTISLSTLPNELELRILHFAGWRAAVQLSAVSKHFNDICSEPTFWKRAVIETFHVRIDHFSKDGDWQGAFKTLASGRLFGWGQNGQLLFNDDEFSSKPNQKRNCHFPREVTGKKYQGIVDVQSGGWSVSLLTLSGIVLTSGSLDGSTAWVSCEPRTVQFPSPDERILQISSGRSHLLALSDSGRIWSVRGSFTTPAVIQFLTPTGTVENPICTKVVAGWTGSGALIKNYGLFLWFDQAPPSQSRPTSIRPDPENHGLPVLQVDIKRISYFVDVYGDYMHQDPVVDFAIGEHFVVLVTSSGKVFALDIENPQQEEFVPMQLVNIVAPEDSPKIDRVEGKFRDFAVFNSNGLVHILKAESIKTQFAQQTPQYSSINPEIRTATVTPHVVEELNNHHILDISFGDWHALALTDTGKVLTWGRDSASCGALGHGDRETAEKVGVRYVYRDGILDKPTPLRFGEGEFFAYKVSAAGWRSCALVAEVSGKSALTAGAPILKAEMIEAGKGKGKDKEEQTEEDSQNRVRPPREGGHRGGIAGVPSDARGGNISLANVAMANRPNATGFFGFSPSNQLLAPQLDGSGTHIGGSGENSQGRNVNPGDE